MLFLEMLQKLHMLKLKLILSKLFHFEILDIFIKAVCVCVEAVVGAGERGIRPLSYDALSTNAICKLNKLCLHGRGQKDLE
jgi:hypothetical protein